LEGADVRATVYVSDEYGSEPDILVRGWLDGREVRLRYVPKRDVTPWEVATLLRMAVTVHTHPSRDWIEWITRHGLLRHFEPT
jgi:hypothetical protein